MSATRWSWTPPWATTSDRRKLSDQPRQPQSDPVGERHCRTHHASRPSVSQCRQPGGHGLHHGQQLQIGGNYLTSRVNLNQIPWAKGIAGHTTQADRLFPNVGNQVVMDSTMGNNFRSEETI